MTEIVEQQRDAQQAALGIIVAFVSKVLRRMGLQRLDGTGTHRQGAERVREARMLGRRKGEIRKSQLTKASQPLERRAVHQGDLGLRQLDEPVDRVEYPLHAPPVPPAPSRPRLAECACRRSTRARPRFSRTSVRIEAVHRMSTKNATCSPLSTASEQGCSQRALRT